MQRNDSFFPKSYLPEQVQDQHSYNFILHQRIKQQRKRMENLQAIFTQYQTQIKKLENENLQHMMEKAKLLKYQQLYQELLREHINSKNDHAKGIPSNPEILSTQGSYAELKSKYSMLLVEIKKLQTDKIIREHQYQDLLKQLNLHSRPTECPHKLTHKHQHTTGHISTKTNHISTTAGHTAPTLQIEQKYHQAHKVIKHMSHKIKKLQTKQTQYLRTIHNLQTQTKSICICHTQQVRPL